MAGKQDKGLPTEEQVEKFGMLSGLLHSIFDEMKDFSKKKPEGALNQVKVKIINNVLGQIKGLLSSQPTVDFLELLNDEALPTYSDAVLIISQYNSAMTQFIKKFYLREDDFREGRWITRENP